MGTNEWLDGPRLLHLNQWLQECDHARVTSLKTKKQTGHNSKRYIQYIYTGIYKYTDVEKETT